MIAENADDLVSLPRSERVAQLFGFDPFDYQTDVLDADAHRLTWVCGRQVGKAETASVVPADYALINADADVLIAARFQETADELFRRTKTYLEELGSLSEIGVTRPNAQTYEFDNGSRIMSRTLGHDARQQRGKIPKCVIVEEAALVDRDVFDRVLRPMFAMHDDYELWLISTPRGKSSYLYDKHEHSDGWTSFHNETADNPLVATEWLEKMRADVDAITWRQEYLGEFVETGDVYLPRSLVAPCITDQQPQRTPSAHAWLGVDPARSGADSSVYVSVDEYSNVFDVRSRQTETIPDIVERIKSLDREYGYAAVLVDENGLGAGVVDYSAQDLPNIRPVTFSSKSKQDLYQTLKRVLESENLELPRNDRLIHELTHLEYDFTSTGILRVSHPPGGHDDHADATALAIWGWQQADRQGPIRRTRELAAPTPKRRQCSR